ncbi:MAG: hypothetical protein EP298_07400 [Gammaproteobacteria bacterium]|nr:MAG: hypothetical protein EP298_07400 [Gammaproteobacteria bacterium]UTW42664.1 hypothetical protein KFE69_00525 [bacterium SCSIO 12844]
MKNNVLKFVCHSKKTLDIAAEFGWLAGAKYTNLRDIKHCSQVGFIDIDWENYCFQKHINAVMKTKPLYTVAKDIVDINELDQILYEAEELSNYAENVILVPKDQKLKNKLELLPRKYVLGYSVPTKYGGTEISTKYFNRPVHLLGGRPDVQRKLANEMPVVSFDCNRFTLDAKFGDYFNGKKFIQHPIGGYEKCLYDSIKNITKLWSQYE